MWLITCRCTSSCYVISWPVPVTVMSSCKQGPYMSILITCWFCGFFYLGPPIHAMIVQYFNGQDACAGNCKNSKLKYLFLCMYCDVHTEN